MSDADQSLESVEFADPLRAPAGHLRIHMQGAPIDAMNAGLRAFRDDLDKHILARRVEIAVVSFHNEITVEQDFVTADQFQPSTLTAGGLTRIGSAIHKALDMLQARKLQYKADGVSYDRPWFFLLTDRRFHVNSIEERVTSYVA